MLHSFLPPAVPPVLGNLTNNQNLDLNHSNLGRNQNQSPSTGLETKNKDKTNHSHSSQVINKISRERLIAGKALSTPSSPEALPPEFSPPRKLEKVTPLLGKSRVGKPRRNSFPLGNQLSVGYPVQPTYGRAGNREFSLPVEEAKTGRSQNTSVKSSNNSATQNPIQIKFNSSGKTTPATIEFKSRQPISQATQPETKNPQKTKLDSPNSNQEPVNTENTPTPNRRVIEVIADRQEYDEQRRIITAEGKVVVRFDGTVVDAERLQVNLDNSIAVGEGNVALARGDQLLRGDKFTYNFIQDRGELQGGKGEIFIPTAGRDFSFLPTDVTTGGITEPISDRIRANQPLTASSPGAVNFTIGGVSNVSNLPTPKQGGVVKKVRFEAARVDFYPRGWQAQDVTLTNDPFSPPELEVRAKKVTLTRKSPLKARIKTQGQRLVFDRGLSLPIPKNSQTIDRRERDVTPGLVSFGFDGDERGGLFLERRFQIRSTETSRWSITPQFFVQEATEGPSNIASVFGLKSRLNFDFSERTVLEGTGSLTSLDLSQVEDNLRANLRLRQQLGNLQNPHNLTMQFNYRDRLFNGTLGFQTVQSSIGGILTSPIIPLGKGINFSYKTGAQYITTDTDRQDLLDAVRDNNRVSLGRFQGSAALSGGLLLWRGKGLPPTAKEGLRYTPNPVVPFLTAYAGVTGTSSFYTNGDNQSTLIGSIGLQGQLGYFSKQFFDYTGFNISLSQGINSGTSPFLFDRNVDTTVLSAGITQQLYGPLRVGFQTTINLDTGESSTTDYILEYSRRTYGITFRYNPVLELGAVSFRISDFNWTGGTNPFDPSEVKPVVGGVKRGN
ncbi:FIG00873517: hypothetical protein [Richelia intracellularis]|nr:FIG00873517: hypothetical protein [Richelia intracellularis]